MNKSLKLLTTFTLATFAGIITLVGLLALFFYLLAPILETYVFPPPEPHPEGLGIISLDSNFIRAAISSAIFYLFSTCTAAAISGFILRRGGYNIWYSLLDGFVIGICGPIYLSFVAFNSFSPVDLIFSFPGILGGLLGHYIASRKYSR